MPKSRMRAAGAERGRAWAIQVRHDSGRWHFIGVGWYDWALARPGLTTMTWRTRTEARAAASRVEGPVVRVVPVMIRVNACGTKGGHIR